MLKYFYSSETLAGLNSTSWLINHPERALDSSQSCQNSKRWVLKVKLIETFDYDRFFSGDESYLLEVYGSEEAQWHLKKGNLIEVRHLILRFLRQFTPQLRPATIQRPGYKFAGLKIDVRGLARTWLWLTKKSAKTTYCMIQANRQNRVGRYLLRRF